MKNKKIDLLYVLKASSMSGEHHHELVARKTIEDNHPTYPSEFLIGGIRFSCRDYVFDVDADRWCAELYERSNLNAFEAERILRNAGFQVEKRESFPVNDLMSGPFYFSYGDKQKFNRAIRHWIGLSDGDNQKEALSAFKTYASAEDMIRSIIRAGENLE